MSESESESVSVDEVAAIEKKVEQGAIGLTFNSKLPMMFYVLGLYSEEQSHREALLGYVHVTSSR